MSDRNIKAFVISLKRSSDRREKFAKEHDWLDYEFFDAIDAQKKIPYLERIKEKYRLKEFSAGVIGCLLSHRGLWKKLLNSDCDGFYIFEDDVKVDRDKFQYWNTIVGRTDDDIVFLGAHDTNSIPCLWRLGNLSPKYGFISKSFEDTLYCNYAYYVSRKCCRFILDNSNLYFPCDYWAIISKGRLVLSCIYPNIAKPNELSAVSSIQSSKQEVDTLRWLVGVLIRNFLPYSLYSFLLPQNNKNNHDLYALFHE